MGRAPEPTTTVARCYRSSVSTCQHADVLPVDGGNEGRFRSVTGESLAACRVSHRPAAPAGPLGAVERCVGRLEHVPQRHARGDGNDPHAAGQMHGCAGDHEAA
jgi:hypothetical protein